MSESKGCGIKGDDISLMKSLLANYTKAIQQIPKPRARPIECKSLDQPVTTILTGSTGTVGTYLLRALLDRPEIGHIFCLNRSKDGGRTTQRARLADAGLEVDAKLIDERVSFLHADLSQPLLGLDEALYEALRTQVGLIVHNAWTVNFNLGLTAFEPQLAGLVNLVRLATESSLSRAPRIVFISSIAAVGGLAAEGQPVPERVFTSFTTPSSGGYAQSKFLAELLCDTTVKQLGVPSTLIRVGQVAGPIRQPGEWNRNEAIPSLLIASAEMACLPENIGMFSEVDWIPVDLLSDVLIELSLCKSDLASDFPGAENQHRGVQVFNLRNSHTTTWEALLPSIVQAIRSTRVRSDHAPEIVPPSTWLARLSGDEREAGGSGAKSSNAASKLLDFYQNQLWRMGQDAPENGVKPMEINQSLARSAALCEVQAVGGDWVRKWVNEWMAS